MVQQDLNAVERFLIGSVSENIVRSAKCDVLVVRTPEELNIILKIALNKRVVLIRYKDNSFFSVITPATRIVSRAIITSSFVGMTNTFTGE